MTLGTLGSVVFKVSSKTVTTISSMSWKKQFNYSTHKMHRKKGILEYTGQDPDEIELDVEVSAVLGVNPLELLHTLNKMAEKRAVVSFILGTDVIGTSWVITSIHVVSDRYFKDGTMLSAELKIKIKEYGEE